MSPRLESCYFAADRVDDPFERMALVLRHTAAEHCADWDRRIERIEPTPRTSAIGRPIHVANAQKIEHWTATIEAAQDGEHLLLIDADTAILQPLNEAWTVPFDLAYTVKRRPFPYNLGVLFVRVSEPIRVFFREWRDENLHMLEEREGVEHWRQTHGGINQASFGRLLERGAMDGLQLHKLKCAEWNCEESGWPTFNPTVARILHIKGELRKMLFHRRFPQHDLMTVATFYRQLEADTKSMARSG